MSTNIFAPPLTVGCTVGLASPCETKSRERLEITATALRSLGFNVRFGTNTFKDTWGYAASASERAEDINRMAADDDVRLVILGGGETATEVLPLLDYELIASKPKRYCSFSDGTSILNAITSQCHLVTYHGQSFRTFDDLSEYNLTNFLTRVMRDDGVYRRRTTGLSFGAVRQRALRYADTHRISACCFQVRFSNTTNRTDT